jgi:molybdopterin/thiamine biosynthesis adenylyltransferase
MEVSFARQEGLISSRQLRDLNVTVVGAGGIGSYTVLSLAKMGVGNIRVIDHDIVEELNIPSQIYRLCDVGKPKVEGCLALVKEATGLEIIADRKLWEGETDDIIVAAVDDMAVRAEIFKSRGDKNKLLVDGRMMAELGRVLTVKDDESAKAYAETLYSDKDAEELPCYAKAIVYNTSILGNIIVSQIKKWVAGEKVQTDVVVDLKTYAFG